MPSKARVIHFVNADLIAAGLSPLKPGLAAIAAARMVLREIDRLAKARADFAFESTLSGLTYVRRLETWRKSGYRVSVYRPLADSWAIYENSGQSPQLLERQP